MKWTPTEGFLTELVMRGQLVVGFRVKSIHSQQELGLQHRQSATVGREGVRSASATVSDLLRRVAAGSFSVSGLQNVSGDFSKDRDGWQPSPGFRRECRNGFTLLILLSTDLCFLFSRQARDMKKQLIDDFLSQNKFLMVARLTNQRLFQELCPVKKSHRQRK